jgi:hypothetical protein
MIKKIQSVNRIHETNEKRKSNGDFPLSKYNLLKSSGQQKKL